ncbi:hypothetical protein [Burkholderia sp. BDU5]|uniref:hypothetical protein n=1 Tax=Burkholderia sp. BDU5 TaxID=1385590 RepID=UPI0012E39247|nr:hypothetical protein [Burkholderia sp. BDU5]
MALKPSICFGIQIIRLDARCEFNRYNAIDLFPAGSLTDLPLQQRLQTGFRQVEARTAIISRSARPLLSSSACLQGTPSVQTIARKKFCRQTLFDVPTQNLEHLFEKQFSKHFELNLSTK